MNEAEFAGKIVEHLNQSAAQLPPETVRELSDIRSKVLAQAASRPAPPVQIGWTMAFSAAVLAVVGTSYFLLRPQDDLAGLAAHEVEARVMTDELPPQAHLDEGFKNWLQQRSKP